MAKYGDLIQVKWTTVLYPKIEASPKPHIVHPRGMRKDLEFDNAPAAHDDDEWVCRVISDSKPNMHQIGKMKVQFVKTVKEEWVFEPTSPIIYDCQEVEPVYKCGARYIRHVRPGSEVMAEVERINAKYREALEKAKRKLAPIIAANPGIEEYAIEVDLPGLKGWLISQCRNDVTHLGPLVFKTEFVCQTGDTLYRKWLFTNNGKGDEVGLTALATKLGKDHIIIDLRHTLAELGEPAEVSTGCLYWIAGKNRIALELVSDDEIAKYYPEIIAHLVGNPREDALKHPTVGPRIRAAIEEDCARRDHFEAESVRRAEEAAKAQAQQRAAEERQRQHVKAHAPKPVQPPAGPATIDSLKAKFGRK